MEGYQLRDILYRAERIIFGRSHISRVAEARLDAINKYCQVGYASLTILSAFSPPSIDPSLQILMHMHPSISQALHVWKFFSYRTGDKIIPK